MKIFDEINDENQDVICCNAMMEAYSDNKMNKEAINLFFSAKMCNKSWQMVDNVSYLIALKACGNAKSYHCQVVEIARKIRDTKCLFQDCQLATQLTSCYGKLGYYKESEQVFAC